MKVKVILGMDVINALTDGNEVIQIKEAKNGGIITKKLSNMAFKEIYNVLEEANVAYVEVEK